MSSSEKNYTGLVIGESLTDELILNMVHIRAMKITPEQNPSDRSHIYKVGASEDDIAKISSILKTGYYAHFWKGSNGDEMLVVFKDKIFQIDHNDKTTWRDATQYGLVHGIPADKLDFIIE